MDNISAAISHSLSQAQQVSADKLSAILDDYLPTIKILSLDCFDTLLWRHTATPADVFYDLQHSPHFKSLGFTARLRKEAEQKARHKKRLQGNFIEVSLKDIYSASNHALTDEQCDNLADDEMSAEIAVCHAFYPVVELIKKAHHHGMKIIIVSDTYFNEKQLRHLLRSKLPNNIFPLISNIFCSSDYGQSKSSGLFDHVLKSMNAAPQTMLHIGDNQIADFNAPKAYHINTVRLLHHHNHINEVLRMSAISASFIDPGIRNTRSLISPFRSLLAEDMHMQGNAENTIGYASVGPIMYAFGKYICREVERLQQSGKRIKILFLMRDAYLPSLACHQIMGKEIGCNVRISRFAALAASFRTTHDIDEYLATRIQVRKFAEICKQLLIPEKLAQYIIAKTDNASDPVSVFNHEIHQENVQRIIFAESAAYRARLYQHLKKTCAIENGDTLMFVDLGYTGTAQIKLQPVFKEEFSVDIIGRYLLSMPSTQALSARQGLLDSSYYDDNALVMLVTYIALLEQICTSKDKSVVDYDNSGNVIESDSTISESQYKKLDALQAQCIRFVRNAEKYMNHNNMNLEDQILRDMAAINLCRLLFLPTQSEIDYLQSFQFDFNMGSDKVISVLNIEQGLTGLRRRGWLHCSKETAQQMRTNYPAEWRAANIELALTLMSQHRFGLEFARNDLSLRRESLNVLIMQNQHVSPLTMEALPTHDGYYSVLIPVVNSHCQIGICLGEKYHWVEVDSAELIQMNKLYTSHEVEHTQDAGSFMNAHELVHKQGGLYECMSQQAMLIFNPANKAELAHHILRIVFRPVVYQ